MSMAPTTEPQSTPSDLGQRLFLLGVFTILLVEVVCTVANVGQCFEWTSCVLGIVASVGILYLGNWLYTGSTSALAVTRIWVVVQLMLVLVAMGILLSVSFADSTFPQHVGVNALWQGYLKLIVYLGFAGLLFIPGLTLDFLSAQRGQVRTPTALATNSELAAPGSPVELGAEQTKALDGLGAAMRTVSGVLLIVGALDLVVGMVTMAQNQAAGLLSIVEGIAVWLLGAELWAPGKALHALQGASPRTMPLMMNVFTTLLGTFKAYLLLLVILLAVLACRLMLNLL
jgi:hypothetical protein